MIWTYWWSYIIIVPGLLLAIFAQALVSSTYKKYARVSAKSGWTAEHLSEKLLHDNGCMVRIAAIRGNLTDNYNPSTKVLSLSQSTFGKDGIAALGVAAHEVGHAVQDAEDYLPLRLRSVIVPVVNFGSGLAIPLLLIGILFEIFVENPMVGNLFITLAIVAYSLATVFSLVTLPVEFNASRRAMAMLEQSGALDREELKGARKVLTAAALTYDASLLVSMLYLLRFILIASQFKRK